MNIKDILGTTGEFEYEQDIRKYKRISNNFSDMIMVFWLGRKMSLVLGDAAEVFNIKYHDVCTYLQVPQQIYMCLYVGWDGGGWERKWGRKYGKILQLLKLEGYAGTQCNITLTFVFVWNLPLKYYAKDSACLW